MLAEQPSGTQTHLAAELSSAELSCLAVAAGHGPAAALVFSVQLVLLPCAVQLLS